MTLTVYFSFSMKNYFTICLASHKALISCCPVHNENALQQSLDYYHISCSTYSASSINEDFVSTFFLTSSPFTVYLSGVLHFFVCLLNCLHICFSASIGLPAFMPIATGAHLKQGLQKCFY